MTRAVRTSCGLYKMLLFVYPADFRLRFGREMITTFSDLIYDEWERSAGNRSSVTVRARGSVFCRRATPAEKVNCGCDVAVAAFVVRLVYSDIL